MSDVAAFRTISPTILADVLSREQVMNIGIRPLWSSMPRVAGPAYTVRCPPGDNLMLHAAIYRAEPGGGGLRHRPGAGLGHRRRVG